MAKPNNLNKINQTARRLADQIRHFGVVVPTAVAERYELLAEKNGVDTGIEMANRLSTCFDHTAKKPLYFSDENRQALELLLDNNFSRPEQVIESVRSLMSRTGIEADGETATLVMTPNQLYRLEERARVAGKSIAQYCKDLALQAINQEIGLY